MTPERLSHFRIESKLGEGGMGEVFRATDERLGREVAIKILPAAVTDDPDRLARLEREARILASLNHPNIAGLHDIGQSDGVHYLVMEHVEGHTLRHVAEEVGTFPEALLREIALQVAAGLSAIHEAGAVHRDLKPENVLISEDQRVRIMDLGDARLVEEMVVGGERRADRAPGVTGRGLDPDAVEVDLAQDAAIGDAIERHAAREAEMPAAGPFHRRARQADEAFAVVTASMGVSGDVEPAGDREAIGAVGDEPGSVGEDSNDPPRRSGRARKLQSDLAGPPRGSGGPIPARREERRELED